MNHVSSNPLSASRRNDLLDQLGEIIRVDGFIGLRLDDFAARLQCSKTTLYRLAPSKERLVAAAARHFFSRATFRIERAVADAPSPPEKLRAYLTNVGREVGRGSLAFHEQMATEPATAEIYSHQADAAAERLGELIQEGIEAGDFHLHDGAFAAQIVATIIRAIHLGGLVAWSPGAMVDAHAKLAELLLYGLVGGGQSPPQTPTPSDPLNHHQIAVAGLASDTRVTL
jgi:AcrR family transcriptional regulator